MKANYLHFALLSWQHGFSLDSDLVEMVCLEIEFDFGYRSEKKTLALIKVTNDEVYIL